MTSYRIADTAQDYKRVHALIKSEGFPDCSLNFPVIMAMDEEGELVGCLGTGIQDDMIVAGPLVLKKDKKRSFTLIRLVEHYEATMRQCGIKSFIFYVELDNEKYLDYVKRVYGAEPYAEQDGRAWFVADLTRKE